MEWLVCFWLWCECGVQPDHTSLNHRPFRQVLVCDLYPCLLKHVRVKTEAVLLIMPELIPQRSKLTCVCWFVLQTSPSVCNHSSPASIREVIPKCLSPENNSQYKTPVATERASGYRKSKDPEHYERGPDFPGCTCRSCRQGSVCPWEQTAPHLPKHFHSLSASLYRGSRQVTWQWIPAR